MARDCRPLSGFIEGGLVDGESGLGDEPPIVLETQGSFMPGKIVVTNPGVFDLSKQRFN